MLRYADEIPLHLARVAIELDERYRGQPRDLPETLAFSRFLSEKEGREMWRRPDVSVALFRALCTAGFMSPSAKKMEELDRAASAVAEELSFLAQRGMKDDREQIAKLRDFAVAFSNIVASGLRERTIAA